MNVVNFPKDRVIGSLPSPQSKIVRSSQFQTNGNVSVDVNQLAERLGARIEHRKPKVVSRKGAVYFNEVEQKYVVLVNPDTSENIQRYTIAHELSHILLHPEEIGKGHPVYRGDVKGMSSIEREADALAAEILMPARLIFQRVMRLGYDISSLSNEFAVSDEAMEIRLSEVLLKNSRTLTSP